MNKRNNPSDIFPAHRDLMQNLFAMGDDRTIFGDQVIVFADPLQGKNGIGNLPPGAGRKGNLLFFQLS